MSLGLKKLGDAALQHVGTAVAKGATRAVGSAAAHGMPLASRAAHAGANQLRNASGMLHSPGGQMAMGAAKETLGNVGGHMLSALANRPPQASLRETLKGAVKDGLRDSASTLTQGMASGTMNALQQKLGGASFGAPPVPLHSKPTLGAGTAPPIPTASKPTISATQPPPIPTASKPTPAASTAATADKPPPAPNHSKPTPAGLGTGQPTTPASTASASSAATATKPQVAPDSSASGGATTSTSTNTTTNAGSKMSQLFPGKFDASGARIGGGATPSGITRPAQSSAKPVAPEPPKLPSGLQSAQTTSQPAHKPAGNPAAGVFKRPTPIASNALGAGSKLNQLFPNKLNGGGGKIGGGNPQSHIPRPTQNTAKPVAPQPPTLPSQLRFDIGNASGGGKISSGKPEVSSPASRPFEALQNLGGIQINGGNFNVGGKITINGAEIKPSDLQASGGPLSNNRINVGGVQINGGNFINGPSKQEPAASASNPTSKPTAFQAPSFSSTAHISGGGKTISGMNISVNADGATIDGKKVSAAQLQATTGIKMTADGSLHF